MGAEDLIRLYTGKAPPAPLSGDMLTQKLLIQELTQALEAAHAEKVSAGICSFYGAAEASLAAWYLGH